MPAKQMSLTLWRRGGATGSLRGGWLSLIFRVLFCQMTIRNRVRIMVSQQCVTRLKPSSLVPTYRLSLNTRRKCLPKLV